MTDAVAEVTNLDDQIVIANLLSLVVRLTRTVRRVAPGEPIAQQASSYVDTLPHLTGGPLREVLPRNAPGARAALILKEARVHTTPVPIMSIATHLGVRVVCSTPSDSVVLGTFRIVDGVPTITVPSGDADDRKKQRFAIAHMLGHFALGDLHVPAETSSTFNSNCSDVIERDANDFALKLLMPEFDLRAAWNSGKYRTLDQIANAFEVSQAAMDVRLHQLNIL